MILLDEQIPVHISSYDRRLIILFVNTLMHSTVLSTSLDCRDISRTYNPIAKVLCCYQTQLDRFNEPPSFLSSAYRLIMGLSISKISCSLTDDLSLSDLGSCRKIPVKLIDALAMIPASKHKIIRSRCLADACKLCDPRPRTPVRTSSHSHDNT